MAFDAFLKISTIPGESTDEKFKDCIEIVSFTCGVVQPTSGAVSTAGGRTSERADHLDFLVIKAIDKASPKLFLSCCNGDHIPDVTLTLNRSGKDKVKYMEYKMSDVIVRSVRPGGNSKGPDQVPHEEVSFAYGKIAWTYTETDHSTGKPKGDVKGQWSCITNSGS